MKRVTLSFDNGPTPEVTPKVLDVLRANEARAHFFVLGKLLAAREGHDLVKRTVDEGHLVGNHSFSHDVPLGEDPRSDAVEQEIVATERLLQPFAGGAKRFRPFGGGGLLGSHLLSRAAVDYLVARAYSCVLWSSVPRDWADKEGWPARALADVAAQEHTLLVLHDVPNACLDELDGFLRELRSRDVAIVLDLPSAHVPIVDGRIVGDLTPLVGAPESQPARHP